MSPSGFVITRLVKPLPAPVNTIAVVPAPTTTPDADTEAGPLDADVDEPAPLATPSNGAAGSNPLYSNTRTSGNGTEPLNDTDTLFTPAPAALMLGAK